MKYLLLSLMALISISVQANNAKIGYINIDQVVNASPQFASASQKLIKTFKPQEKKLVKLNQDLQTLVDKFNNKKEGLSKENINSLIAEIKSLEQRVKSQALLLQKQLKQANEQELEKIQTLINLVIKEVAKKQAFDLILYQEVAFASNKVNITQVISNKLKELF